MTKTEMTTYKGFYWDTVLDWKDIDQTIIKYLGEDTQLSTLFTPETVQNGVKQFIYSGLLEKKLWKKEITIADFNPAEPSMGQTYILADNMWKYAVKTPNAGLEGFERVFSTEAIKKAFKNGMVEKLLTSLRVDLFKYRAKTLLTSKLYGMNKLGAITSTPYLVDDLITIDTWGTDIEIKKALEVLRLKLVNYETPGIQHTLFSRDPLNKKYVSAFKPKDFTIIWNTKFWNTLNTLTATLFNKDDVLLSGPKQLKYDFITLATAGLKDKPKTDAEAVAEKLIAFIVHKDALKEVMPTGTITGMVQTLNFQTIYEALASFGTGRIKLFPIVKVVLK